MHFIALIRNLHIILPTPGASLQYSTLQNSFRTNFLTVSVTIDKGPMLSLLVQLILLHQYPTAMTSLITYGRERGDYAISLMNPLKKPRTLQSIKKIFQNSKNLIPLDDVLRNNVDSTGSLIYKHGCFCKENCIGSSYILNIEKPHDFTNYLEYLQVKDLLPLTIN